MTDRPRFECPACGWISIPPATVTTVFHPCPAQQSRRSLRRRDTKNLIAAALDRDAERAQWAAATFGPLRDSLEGAVEVRDPDALYRGDD